MTRSLLGSMLINLKKLISSDRNKYAVLLIYKSIKLNKKNNVASKIRRRYVNRKLFYRYHIVIGDNCSIGSNLVLPHAQNIIFGKYSQVGDNCKIYQDVTLGLKNTDGIGTKNDYPKIEDNCIVCCGTRILGGIVVKEGTTIAANSVLIQSTENDSLYAGSPAIFKKWLKQK